MAKKRTKKVPAQRPLLPAVAREVIADLVAYEVGKVMDAAFRVGVRGFRGVTPGLIRAMADNAVGNWRLNK